MSSNFGHIGPLTAELAAVERLKIDISTYTLLLLIRTFLNFQVTRTCTLILISTSFGQIGRMTAELVALEYLIKITWAYNGKIVFQEFMDYFSEIDIACNFAIFY